MLTRRELVTGSAVGALASVAGPAADATAAAIPAATFQPPPPQDIDNAALRRIADSMTKVGNSVDQLSGAFRTNTLAYGFAGSLRAAYTLYWKSHSKFPDFCEVGTDVFYDIYDWHLRQRLTPPVSRLQDGRLVITFMYTQLLVRVDQSGGYIGIPFDRQ